MVSQKAATTLFAALLASATLDKSSQCKAAFINSTPPRSLCRTPARRPRPYAACRMVPTDNDYAEAEDEDGVETERRRLEALMRNEGGSGSGAVDGGGSGDVKDTSAAAGWEDQIAAGPPPLTAIGRERLETEIALLRSLEDGDGAVGRLWVLWYNERGPGPAAELAATDILVARGPGSYEVAEDMLRKLIAREGIYWTEAVNRLATLLFLRGRLEESKEACEVVLRVKPWHFGALSGIVMVCQGLNDLDGVVGWAGQRMPPLQAELSPVMGDGVVRETRSEWVERMVEEAQKTLRKAERGVQESFLDLDAGGNNDGAILGDEKDGAWE